MRASGLAALWFAAALALAYGYFYQGGGWNQGSRMNLVRAIVEDGSLQIDRFATNTGDVALVGGHAYSDKAPGVALTAVPVVAVARAVIPGADTPVGVVWLHWLATLFVAGIPTIAAALALRGLAMRLGAGPGGGWIAAAVFAVGTPAWAYATLMWGHALAASCIVVAVALAVRAAADDRPRTLVGLGLAAGWAILTELSTVPAIAIVLGLAAYQLRVRGASLVRATALVAAGAVLPAALLFGYNAVAFGSPFAVGYQSVAGFEGMQRGLLGVCAPRAYVAGEILFGEYRGLLRWAPVLAIAPLGLWLSIRSRPARPLAVACSAIVVYFLLFNAGYYYWHGGSSFGPRHFAPALPFLAAGVGVVWSRAARLPRRHVVAARAGIGATAAVGAALVFVAVSVTAQPREAWLRPLADEIWPAFVHGELGVESRTIVDATTLDGTLYRRGAWNLGHVLGLERHASLMPLAGAWLAIGAAALAFRRRRRTRAQRRDARSIEIPASR
jgi:hypothetical protein